MREENITYKLLSEDERDLGTGLSLYQAQTRARNILIESPEVCVVWVHNEVTGAACLKFGLKIVCEEL